MTGTVVAFGNPNHQRNMDQFVVWKVSVPVPTVFVELVAVVGREND